MSNTAENYLADLGKEIVKLAQEQNRKRGMPVAEFERGRQFAYYEVLSLMKQQAKAFGLNDGDLGLEDVNVEELLT